MRRSFAPTHSHARALTHSHAHARTHTHSHAPQGRRPPRHEVFVGVQVRVRAGCRALSRSAGGDGGGWRWRWVAALGCVTLKTSTGSLPPPGLSALLVDPGPFRWIQGGLAQLCTAGTVGGSHLGWGGLGRGTPAADAMHARRTPTLRGSKAVGSSDPTQTCHRPPRTSLRWRLRRVIPGRRLLLAPAILTDGSQQQTLSTSGSATIYSRKS